ncbi:MAG TPA: FtsX-like permease family protein, partial [Vicinamibacterales bacterium]
AVCGAVQVWTSRRATPALALTGGQKGASAGREQRRSHAVLIVVEVAACLTLLVGASLMIETGLRILNVPMGLDPRDVTVARLSLDQRKYPDAASRSTFYDRVVDGMRAADRLRSLAFANSWPLQQAPFRDVGRDEPGAAFAARVGMTGVSGSYFETLSITLEGRTFTSADTPTSEPVAVVSRTLAARLWPGRSAIGERIRVAPREDAEPGTQAVSYAVVGVAADVRHTHTDTDLADLYVSLGQYATPAPFMYVRTAGAAPRMEQDLRALIARLDPDMALLTPRPLGDILDQQRAGSRLLASLLAVFAGVSTVLALVGIYGVIAYTVKQREREIAVRIAIGADRGVITRMFLRQGAVVLGTGLLIGVGGALALGRVLQTQLFGVRPAEPIAIAVATALLGLCGLAAVGLPSRAAASTDPAAALKN